MIELSPLYAEASGKIQFWRNKYTRNEYPHKIVINMMYRAYATQFVYQAFQNNGLPPFDDFNEAASYVIRFYGETAISKVHANLLDWMRFKPNELVGTVTTSSYENLATLAENNSSKLEELEFSYIFNTMSDMCVLYFIAFRLCGDSQEEAIQKMTNYQVEIDEELTYAQLKTAFTQLNNFLPAFLQRNYHPF